VLLIWEKSWRDEMNRMGDAAMLDNENLPSHGLSSSDMKKKPARSSETFVFFHITTRRQNPEDLDLNLHNLEINLAMKVMLVITLHIL
jgi:hypothetical protein